MKLSVFASVLIAATLSACASTGEETPRNFAEYEGDPRLGQAVSSACYGFEIDSFRETTRDSVIIEGRGRSEYLLTTRACFDLQDALALGVDGRGGCLTRGDKLVVSNTILPALGQNSRDIESCLITGIYEWNEDAAKPESEGGDDAVSEGDSEN